MPQRARLCLAKAHARSGRVALLLCICGAQAQLTLLRAHASHPLHPAAQGSGLLRACALGNASTAASHVYVRVFVPLRWHKMALVLD